MLCLASHVAEGSPSSIHPTPYHMQAMMCVKTTKNEVIFNIAPIMMMTSLWIWSAMKS